MASTLSVTEIQDASTVEERGNLDISCFLAIPDDDSMLPCQYITSHARFSCALLVMLLGVRVSVI